MRSFSLAALLLASTAAALPRNECFRVHSKDLAEYTDCGNRAAVSQCLASLSSFEPSDLEPCYTNAGCSASQAALDAQYITTRCQEYSSGGGSELRKRFRAALEPVQATQAVAAAAAHLLARATTTPAPVRKGADCFSVSEFPTSSCDVATENGKAVTRTCTPSKGTSSECLSGWICTVDNAHQDICMKTQPIDTGGIIIAIVFAAFFAIGLGYLTFACCRERKHHKRVAAKAEAVALARAATKKQRSQEARAPLMQQTQEAASPNPFQDQPGNA
ncbi:hypothetical protein J3459_014811 [Metarhizium acridum]|uniref:Uncharacterized protein n=1 Tax=Metarhizium acridum (strain CQMa 102) TaxID=655827 RepID=E9EEJ1_METAQ|nr:uncharacterized protein MAC_08289 [Metarhizium acridum CQMa 102]EFY85642.1 hypothetical protein MAC_08289 [Metarhizium acridum CQMa 102]KAG8412319.1 hypothetical protein J3458_014503 [Metarhizium acridum]KAG8414370.1 hypothetical protein J3459_014811 [Metarhizium acridum]